MKPTIVIQSLWALGGSMIIFLAGLKQIPTTLYEAAALDGASPWRQFRSVTLPMLGSVTFFVATVSVINAVQVFTQGYVSFDKAGGPKNAALFAVMYLFQQAFAYFKIGYAATISWVLFAIIIALTLLQFRLSNRWVYYEGEQPEESCERRGIGQTPSGRSGCTRRSCSWRHSFRCRSHGSGSPP